MPTMKQCRNCGAILGQLITIEHKGASVTVLDVGGMYLLDTAAVCKSCGCYAYHHIRMSRLLTLLRTAKQEEKELEK